MKLSKEIIEQLQADMENAKDMNDLLGKNGVIKNLLKHLTEEMLENELTRHLGYEKNQAGEKPTANRRNGKSGKRMRSSYGELSLDIPRDRQGEFEPVLIEKYDKDPGPIEDKVLSTYFKYPAEIRRLIYTTNILEGVHRQFRKVTKTKSVFSNEEALLKLLFLAQGNMSQKWKKAYPGWAYMISQFAIIFEGRVKLDI